METCEDGNDLVFFYQVCKGVASASHASHTAAQAGLPETLIARGKEVRYEYQPPSGLLVPAPLRGLGFWAHGISEPCFFSHPPPPNPLTPTFFFVVGLRLDPQWKTHQACQGVVEGEANGKVSVCPLSWSSLACSASFLPLPGMQTASLLFKVPQFILEIPKCSGSWVSYAVVSSLCSGTRLAILP